MEESLLLLRCAYSNELSPCMLTISSSSILQKIQRRGYRATGALQLKDRTTKQTCTQILFVCLFDDRPRRYCTEIGILSKPVLCTAGDLGVADRDRRTTPRNAGQNFVALLDIDNRRSRGRGLHPVLGVGCTGESDTTEISKGDERPVLLEILYYRSACGIFEVTTSLQTSTIHSALVSQSVPSTPPVNVWVTVLPLVLFVITALPEVVEVAVTVRVTLSPAEKVIPLKS